MKKEDLITAIDKANKIFKTLMFNYQGLKGYLVLSSPYGQFELIDDALQSIQILKDFPDMISESEFKDKGIKLFETIQRLEVELKHVSHGNKKAEIQKKLVKESNLLNSTLEKIEFKEDTFIEIRFKWPILDLIFKMQKDPLVSQLHTSQTKASVRIVLGTLVELTQKLDNLRSNKNV